MAFAAPEEYGRQAERDRDDQSPGIFLITILMQAEFGARHIAIDQARVGIIVREPGLGSGACRNASGIAGQGTPDCGSTGSYR